MILPADRGEEHDGEEVEEAAAAEDELWSDDASGLALGQNRKTCSRKQRAATQI
jgi:hypothetical protein